MTTRTDGTKKKYLWIVAGISLALLGGALLATGKKAHPAHHELCTDKTTNPNKTKRTNESASCSVLNNDESIATNHPPESIQNTEELIAWMESMLPENEQAVLNFLSGIDPFKWDPGLISTTLADYYARKQDIFGSIESLEILRNSNAHFLFTETVAELLSTHSSHEDPRQLIHFLEAPENTDITLSARHEVGSRMLEGTDNPSSIIELIRTDADHLIRQSLLNGALEKWAVADLPGLLKYLISAPEQADLDRGYEKAAFYTRQTCPDWAVVFAVRIQNKELRNESTAYAAVQLLQQNPTRYNEWINTLDDKNLVQHIRTKVEEFKR